ncbi:MAG: hypothetical protein ABIS51_10330 [Sphingomonas sp.]
MCRLLWSLFRWLRHPAGAALAVLTLVALALADQLPPSKFLQMVLMFAALGAIPLWMEGLAWRRRTKDAALTSHPAMRAKATPANVIAHQPGHGRYPAIIACIGQNREAERSELRLVAERIWRETYLPRATQSDSTPSFALRRQILRAAKFAMSGRIHAHH